MRKAFTLIELLVVVGIIAILVGILIPALGRAQTSARLVKIQANLRSLAQIQEVYTGEYRDSLMVPFEIKKFIANGNGAGTFGAGWGRVRKVGTNIGIEFPDGQGGNNTPFYSEFYAFHWYSVIGGWLNMGDYASEVQFAPADRVIIQRMQDLQDVRPADGHSIRASGMAPTSSRPPYGSHQTATVKINAPTRSATTQSVPWPNATGFPPLPSPPRR